MIHAYMPTIAARAKSLPYALLGLGQQTRRIDAITIIADGAEVDLDEVERALRVRGSHRRKVPHIGVSVVPADSPGTGSATRIRLAAQAAPNTIAFLLDDDFIYPTNFIEHTVAGLTENVGAATWSGIPCAGGYVWWSQPSLRQPLVLGGMGTMAVRPALLAGITEHEMWTELARPGRHDEALLSFWLWDTIRRQNLAIEPIVRPAGVVGLVCLPEQWAEHAQHLQYGHRPSDCHLLRDRYAWPYPNR